MPITSNTLGDMLVRIIGDNVEFDSAIDKSQKKYDKFAKTLEKRGKTLTKFVTLPLVAMATAAVKLAVDAEETAAKFGTAFRDIRKTADASAKNLAKNFGLSQTAAERLLSGTGDLLKGFGATQAQALDLSTQVQELSVDLASYNNIQGGGARASQIITRALLGEREALTTLGTKVSEADVKTRLLAKGMEGLEGQARLLARAQVTLELITEQSGDAMGDFARTSDSVANQLKITRANLEDAAVGFGKLMLPAVQDVLATVNKLITALNELDDVTKKTLIVGGALAAVLGPGLIVLSKFILALKVLKPLLLAVFSPAGLIAIATAAMAAFVVQYALWKKRQEENIILANKNAEILRSTKRAINGVTTALGLENKERIEKLELIRATQEQELIYYEDELEYLERAAVGNVTIRDERGQLLSLTKEEQASAKRGIGVTEIRIAKLKESIALIDAAIEKNKLLNAPGPSGEAGGLTPDQQAIKTAHETIEAGFAAIEQQAILAQKSGEEFNATLEKRDLLLREIEELTEQGFTIAGEGIQSILDVHGELLDQYREELELRKELAAQEEQEEQDLADRAILQEAYNETFNAGLDLLRQSQGLVPISGKIYHDTIEEMKEDTVEWVSLTRQAISGFTNLVSALSASAEQEIQSELDITLKNIETKYGSLTQAELDYNVFLAEEREKRLSEMDDEEKRAFLLKEAADEAEQARFKAAEAEKLEAEQDAAIESAKIARKLAVVKKISSLFSIAADTASGLTRQFTDLPVWAALIAQGLILTAGLANAAAVIAQPLPEIPTFAQGGVVMPRAGGVPAVVAERGVPEVIFPLDRLGDILSQIPGGGLGAGGGGDVEGDMRVIVNLDGRPIIDTIQKASRNRTILIDAGAVVN